MIVIPLAGNGVKLADSTAAAQEAPKQERATSAAMTHNKIIAWAKETDKRLRISTYDMAGEEGWRPLVYADNNADEMNKTKNEEQTLGAENDKAT